MRDEWVITIDGPSGVGKSTVSKALAEKLSYLYLDTGALYRALAFKMMTDGLSAEDPVALKAFLSVVDIDLDHNDGQLRIYINHEDITYKIRSEDVGLMASKVSAIPEVREALLHIQRKRAESGGIVAEGRDMGTVVFPDAEVKFFLEASAHERARRRYDELLLRGDAADYGKVSEDMVKRDKQDRERPVAPLKPHPEAILIDTTSLSAMEVVDRMMDVIRFQQAKRFSKIPE